MGTRRNAAMAGRQRGIALVAVLLVLLLMSVMAASFTRSTRTSNQLARNLFARAEAEALADAGVYRAIAGLFERAPERRLAVDGTPYRIALAGGEVRISLQDEGGKIDLNRAPETMFVALFREAGLADERAFALADAIADYRDRDDDRRPHGAEAADYRAAGRGAAPKNAPFEAIEELRQVLGMDEPGYRLVAPAITVFGRGRRVNRETAPDLVLRALVADEAAVEERLQARSAAGRTLDSDEDAPGDDEGAAGQVARAARFGAVTITSRSQKPGGGVFVREAIVRAVRTNDRGGGRLPFEVLAWRQGTGDADDEPSDDGGN